VRYYDPLTGRFLSLDPWRGSAWRPGTLNRYVYVLNNPINAFDPSGLEPFKLDGGRWIFSGGEYQMGQVEWGAEYGVAERTSIFVPPSTLAIEPSGAAYYNGDINVNVFGCPQDWQIVHYEEGVTRVPEYDKAREFTEPLMYAALVFNPELAADCPNCGPMSIVPIYGDAQGNVLYGFDWPDEEGGNMEPSTPAPLVFPAVVIYNENPNRSVMINGTYPLQRQWGAPNEMYDGLPGWQFNAFSLALPVLQSAAAWHNAERHAATPRHRIYRLVIQQRESSRRAIIETLRGATDIFLGPTVSKYWLSHTSGKIREIPIDEQPTKGPRITSPYNLEFP
jgi:hypothetical protein